MEKERFLSWQPYHDRRQMVLLGDCMTTSNLTAIEGAIFLPSIPSTK